MKTEFEWDGYCWNTTVKLSSWSGFQDRNGSYGSASSNEESNGVINLVFAPEGRGNEPLNTEELKLVSWLIENEEEVHNSLIDSLLNKYPEIKTEFSEYYDEGEISEILPEVKDATDLKKIVGVSSIFVHQINSNEPFFGVELGCTWDEEHGVGVLMHGSKVLEIGGADTAFLLWLAKGYAKDS